MDKDNERATVQLAEEQSAQQRELETSVADGDVARVELPVADGQTQHVEMDQGSEHGPNGEEEFDTSSSNISRALPVGRRTRDQGSDPANTTSFTAEMLPTMAPCQVSELGESMLSTIHARTSLDARRCGGFVMPVQGLPVATSTILEQIRTAINEEIKQNKADFFVFELQRKHPHYGAAPPSIVHAWTGEKSADVIFASKLCQQSYQKKSTNELVVWFDEQISDLRSKVQALHSEQSLHLRYYIDELQSTQNDYLDGLYNLFRPAGAVIAAKGKAVPGVTTPYLYYSDESNTPATMHVEDAGLGSVNLLVAGAPKVWLVIPPASKSDFEQLMQRLFPEAMLSSCSQHVRHIGILILTKALRDNQISFSLVHQHVGDMVVTLKDAYHEVLNEGPNAAVAINIPDPHLAMCPPTYKWCTKSCGGNAYIRANLAHSGRRPSARKSSLQADASYSQSRVCAQRTHSAPTIFPLLDGSTEEKLEQLAGYCENYVPWWLSADNSEEAIENAFRSFCLKGALPPSLCLGMLRLLCGDAVDLPTPCSVGTTHRNTTISKSLASCLGSVHDNAYALVCVEYEDEGAYGFAFVNAPDKKVLYYGLHDNEKENLKSELKRKQLSDDIESLTDWPGVKSETWEHVSKAS